MTTDQTGQAQPDAEQQQRLRALSRSLPATILRAREAVMALFRPVLGQHDLSEQQWRVLRFLADRKSARPGDVSAATRIHVSSLSRIIASLRARGLITRGEDAGDMRAALVAITPAGIDLVARIGPELEDVYAEIERRIGHDDIEAMADLARRIEDALKTG
jgi:homoprotocatechuate degradation regulator HpaR